MILSSLALGLLAAGGQSQPAPMILHADGVVLEDGTVLAGGMVLLRGEVVLAVGQDVPRPAGVEVLRVHGVLAPGFVDPFSGSGVQGRLTEAGLASTPDLRAADALDPEDPFWEAALRAGVTSVQVVPDPDRVIAGWAATASTAGAGERVLEPRSRAVFSLVPSAFSDSVLGPTSLPGGIELLQSSLAARQPALGNRPALFYVDNAEATRAARRVAGAIDAPAAFLAWGDAGAYGGELAGQLVGIPALGEADWSARRLEVWRRLHQAGARIAFGTRGAGNERAMPGALRTTAMAFSRATGDPAAALASITSHAAELAGLGRRLGRIAAGAQADLVLWSAHPLSASARVKAVMIAGRTVYAAPAALPQ